MKCRFLTTLLLLVAFCGVAGDLSAREPERRPLYMFGFAASFTDSVACVTSVQRVDSAWMEPSHKFLTDRELYSLQLQYHMESNEHCKNPVCAVFFGKSERSVQRQWKKIRKRYAKASTLHFSTLPEERFRFKAEEYRPVVIEQEPDTVATSAKAAKPNNGKKKSRP